MQPCRKDTKQDVNSWTIRPFRRCLSPKQRFAFRVATQLDPLDAIVFTALVHHLGADLEARRVPTARRVVHSYRFAPDSTGRLYDPAWSYETFRQMCNEHSESGAFSHVVLADIADFYPRIYAHPLENAVRAATLKTDAANAVLRMIYNWNASVSYGIPVGPAASRLLAETAIADIDDLLLSDGRVFVRYSDDYRIFCTSLRGAHESLASLAHGLFENHGLTLERSKTEVLDISAFQLRFRESPQATERRTLSERFREIIEEAGIADPYGSIEYSDLDQEVQDAIDALNLRAILEEQINKHDGTEWAMVAFVLRRLAQLDDTDMASFVLDNLDSFYPVLNEVVRYITSLRSLDEHTRRSLGERIIEMLNTSLVSHLEYHRCWMLSIFSESHEWDNEDRFVELLGRLTDRFSKRELILALGRANKQFWFKSNKRDFTAFPEWERRAFIAAASCLPGDEAEHWYKSIKAQLDQLERAVVEWAKANPFGSP